MRKLLLIMVIMLYGVCSASAQLVYFNPFKMSPAHFEVGAEGGLFSFDVVLNSSAPANMTQFDFSDYEDPSGQVDDFRCAYHFGPGPFPRVNEIYFKTNETNSPVNGSVTVHYYVTFRDGSTENYWMDFSFTQAPARTPPFASGRSDSKYTFTSESTEWSILSDNVNRTVTQYDQLGRAVQTIQVGASPSGKNIVNFAVYDGMGRADSVVYLPYVADLGSENQQYEPCVSQLAYYQSKFGLNGDYAHSENIYDKTPWGRVVKKSQPGYGHDIAIGRYMAFAESMNDGAYPIWQLGVQDSLLICRGYYPAGTLKVSMSTEEGGLSIAGTESLSTEKDGMSVARAKSMQTYEYTDFSGRLVAKETRCESERRLTYYAYDDLGHQRFIVPPAWSDSLSASGSYTPGRLRDYCYYTEYDEYGQLVRQYVPGAGCSLQLYDKRRREAMSQTAAQRTRNEWSFTKYDVHNRPVLSGTVTGGTYESHKAALDAQTALFERRGSAVLGYTNDTYPIVADAENYLTVSYYDDYAWVDQTTYNFSASNALGQTNTTSVTGLCTGTKARVLSEGISGKWLTTVNYFDGRNRQILSISDLYPDMIEYAANKYDFAGNVVQIRVYQKNKPLIIGGKSSRDLVPVPLGYGYEKWLTYDKQGRLLKVEMQVDSDQSNGRVTLASYTYDELGNMATKSIHNGAETTAYTNDITGRMTRSASPSLTYGLSYGSDNAVSATNWQVAGGTANRYRYTYDDFKQLSSGRLWRTSGTKDVAVDDNAEKDIVYDKNGNMLSMKRYDASGGLMHDMACTYRGNQLTSVRLASGGPVYTGFTYDADGNMTYDPVKGVNIRYNQLDLPQKIFAGSDEVSYIYAADGRKLAKKVGSSYTYYRGAMVYNGSSPEYTLSSEGMVRHTSSGHTYNYFKRDHLGSTRMVLAAVGGTLQVQQTTDYYPYGLAWSTNSLDRNKLLYVGKEYQDVSLGGSVLGMYDFGARYYNPVYGRWFNIDPKLQLLNPYLYCMNSPLSYVDKDGEWFFLIPIVAGAMFNVVAQSDNIHNVGDFFAYFAIGAAGGAATLVGGGSGMFLAGMIMGAGNAKYSGGSWGDALIGGSVSGISSLAAFGAGKFVSGKMSTFLFNGSGSIAVRSAVGGVVGGGAGSYAANFTATLAMTGDASLAARKGFDNMGRSMVMGGLSGMAGGWAYSRQHDLNFWTGRPKVAPVNPSSYAPSVDGENITLYRGMSGNENSNKSLFMTTDPKYASDYAKSYGGKVGKISLDGFEFYKAYNTGGIKDLNGGYNPTGTYGREYVIQSPDIVKYILNNMEY